MAKKKEESLLLAITAAYVFGEDKQHLESVRCSMNISGGKSVDHDDKVNLVLSALSGVFIKYVRDTFTDKGVIQTLETSIDLYTHILNEIKATSNEGESELDNREDSESI